MIRAPRSAALLVVIVAMCGAGCASNQFVAARCTPRSPLTEPLNLLARGGPQPTDRTIQLLRRYDLERDLKKQPDAVLASLQRQLSREPQADEAYAVAELSFINGKKAESKKDRNRALDYYGLAVAQTFQFLFESKFEWSQIVYDPLFRRTCDLYNGSLESAMRLLNREDNLRPGCTHRIRTDQHEYVVTVVSRGNWRNCDFERFEFVSDYEVTGLANQHRTFGLGVPLIAVRKAAEDVKAARPEDQFYPPGLSFAVTAFLRVMEPQIDADGQSRKHCLLELYDPLSVSQLQIGSRMVPLETDLSTPLAYFLNHPQLRQTQKLATLGLINPNLTQPLQGMYMLEPYDPNRIPVLMVHGLWSSPLTWMEMFNDLRAFAEVNEQYQFWFYLYPTGQPFWVSATQLRDDLERAMQVLDPQRQSVALHQMVLVGHSMGGLVSRLQTLESGEAFWRIVSERPFQDLSAPDDVKEQLGKLVYFHPSQSVRRVITIGTPHRGSTFANDTTRYLGRKFIRLPAMLMQVGNGLIRDNPDFFRNTELLTTTTSIDSLSPEAPILPVMLEAPRAPWVKYHNIVGVVPKDNFLGKISADGDGVVPFDSAHLNDVASEIVVPADHTGVHQHPDSVLEVRRILREHRAQFVAEFPQQGRAIPAGYHNPLR